MCVRILALVIRHANCNFPAPHYTVSCGLSDSTIFFHLPNKRNDFREKKNCHKNVFILFYLQFFFETFLILRRIQRDTITNGHRSSCHIFIKPTDFRRILKNKILRKSFQWEPRCSMRTDGQIRRNQRRFLQFKRA